MREKKQNATIGHSTHIKHYLYVSGVHRSLFMFVFLLLLFLFFTVGFVFCFSTAWLWHNEKTHVHYVSVVLLCSVRRFWMPMDMIQGDKMNTEMGTNNMKEVNSQRMAEAIQMMTCFQLSVWPSIWHRHLNQLPCSVTLWTREFGWLFFLSFHFGLRCDTICRL